jgi:hypothetical protein
MRRKRSPSSEMTRGATAADLQGAHRQATDPRGVRRPTTVASCASLRGLRAKSRRSLRSSENRAAHSSCRRRVSHDQRDVIDISHEISCGCGSGWSAGPTRKRVGADLSSSRRGNHVGQQDEAALWGPPDLEVALKWRETQRPNAIWGERYHAGYRSDGISRRERAGVPRGRSTPGR